MATAIQDTSDYPISKEHDIYKEYRTAEKVINEEYKIWKKTVPLIYDTVQTHSIKYPSLTIQWLPEIIFSEDKNSIIAKFIYGTHTSGTSQDYLKIGSIKLPSTLSSETKNSIPIPVNNDDSTDKKIQSVKNWKHKSEVNKVKLSPNGKIISTMGNDGTVYLYDVESNDDASPTELKFHEKEGYALEWLNDNELLSGSGDNKITLWDVNKKIPIKVISTHDSIVNDLSHNKVHPFLFGSCSDDFNYQIHDLRSSNLHNSSIIDHNPSNHIINSFKFHPELETLYVTGGSDNLISLWDIRNPSKPFRKLYGHLGNITNLEFNPLDPKYLSSIGLDKHLLTWDLSLINEEFNESQYYAKNDKAEYFDPMLTFKHGGHTNKINEFSYHPALNNVVVSCGDDCLIEVWKQHFKNEESEHDESEITRD